MKTSLPLSLVAMALFGGTALAGSPPSSDAPRDEMRADTDHDGRISRDEAIAAATERGTGWFDKLDQNKDGYVTRDEMRQARDTRRSAMREHMADRFKEADTNGDDQLSLDEAQAKMPRLAARFSELDADKNGLLSKDELAKAHHGRPQPEAAP